MEIINTITQNNTDAVRLFRSVAGARKNNLRIHYHSTIELSLIVSGRGKYKTRTREYQIREGDMFFFRPNESHCITDIESGGMELLNLHIAPHYIYSNVNSSLDADYLRILSVNYPIGTNKISDMPGHDSCDRLRDAMLNIKREFTQCGRDYEVMINGYIASMLINISRACDDGSETPISRKNYSRLLSAIEYIDENFKSEISLEDIASSAGYSRCYFSSVFKQYMGMSPWDYISIKRIEEALRLIKTTDRTIIDIVSECGFNNTVNFCRIFKKYTNLPPSAFRS